MATITGTSGDDTLSGTPFDDVIDTGGGADHVSAGDGNDDIRLSEPVPNGTTHFGIVDAGPGDDTVHYFGGNFQVSLGDGNDIVSVEALSYNDHATINGGAGTDTLISHVDFILQGFVDLFAGSAEFGHSQFFLNSIENVTVDASGLSPSDYRGIFIDGDGSANAFTVAGPVSPTVHGNAGDDVITGSQLTHALTAFGGSGSDTITGSEQADTLNGGRDPSELPAFDSGDDGGDVIYGMGGNDHIFGNAQGSTQGAVDGGDLIYCGNGSDYANGNAGDDTISGGAGSDRLYGGSGNDSISGDEGNDTVNGNLGDDAIVGGEGNDFIRGGQGDDTIDGGNGNDIISGDKGVDTITGGAGLDIFRFAAGDAAIANGRTDVITDFTHGDDHLALGFTVTAVLGGSAQTSLPTAQTAAQSLLDSHPGGHEVVALQVGTDAYVFWSGTNGATADSAVLLQGVNASSLGSSDFY